jgi:hypothetical protein
MRTLSSMVLCLLSAAMLPALDWPVQGKLITGTFGQLRGDRFQCGIDIGGGEQDVFPVNEGELIFSSDGEDGGVSSVPRGLGTVAVLSHQGGLVSIYAHLKAGSVSVERRNYTTGVRLGMSGDTGASSGTGLHLMLLDRESGAFLNPLGLLPPLMDRQAPVIRSLEARSAGVSWPLEDKTILPSGPLEILVDTYDPRADVPFAWPMAPYSVRLSLNGKEISRILFQSVIVKEGRSLLSGTGWTAREVYAGDRLLRCATIEPIGGASHLVVSVRDYAGNENTREVFLRTSDR